MIKQTVKLSGKGLFSAIAFVNCFTDLATKFCYTFFPAKELLNRHAGSVESFAYDRAYAVALRLREVTSTEQGQRRRNACSFVRSNFHCFTQSSPAFWLALIESFAFSSSGVCSDCISCIISFNASGSTM